MTQGMFNRRGAIPSFAPLMSVVESLHMSTNPPADGCIPSPANSRRPRDVRPPTSRLASLSPKTESDSRPFPHPYKAALAICSDLDETPDAGTYFEIIRFLTTTEDTTMGPGVGLDIGNSIYFDMPPGHFSYWNTTEQNRERIRALIRSGHIDVLHSYGDLATTRAHAARALEELHKHDCHLKVWVDHARAVTNFGADIMQGHGDEPGHPAYHADLTMEYGVKYVWRGRVTSVIGQNRPFRLLDLASDLCPPTSDLRTSISHLPASAVTFAKECAKQSLARCGHRKYALHVPNLVLAPCSLRDGSPTIEFLRCNPHWRGVSCGDRGDRIHEVLTPHFLDRMVGSRGTCVLYTHLGKLDRSPDCHRFTPAVVAAFRRLAEHHRSGKIWITTTGKLLDFLNRDRTGAGPLMHRWRACGWPRAGDGAYLESTPE